MKNLFSSELFIGSGHDKKQKGQSIVVIILLSVLFVAASFLFMNMLYSFADCAGSIVCASIDVAIKDLLRSLPIYFCFIMTLFALLMVHAFYRNVSQEKLTKSVFKNSITIMVFAVINLGYVIVGRIMGKYLSLVEGSPSPLYPLDTILYSLILVALAVFAIIYIKKIAAKSPYVAPSHAPIVTKARFIYCVGMTFWTFIALFCFAGFGYGLFIIDFTHGYLAFSIALLTVYCVNALFLILWEFYFNQMTEEGRKKNLLTIAIIGLVVSVAAAVFYFIALQFNLDGPANVGFGVLPVTFAASVNIATLIVVATPIIVSVIALIKGLIARKK